MLPSSYRYAYLHGFGSGPQSRKGVLLEQLFAAQGVPLLLPDLNQPSFSQLTFGGALDALDALDAELPNGPPWRFIGSSMGGYLAARWAQLHPERVDRLVLLCPGFDLVNRWPNLVGSHNMERWEETGSLLLPDSTGRLQPLHWGFILDARRHPSCPEVSCPTLIIHGRRDETVPLDSSRRYVQKHPTVQLHEVDDDHSLMQTLDESTPKILQFFEIE